MVKGQSFAFSFVKLHQIAGLENSLEGMGYKISDAPIFAGSKTRFTFKKPFDFVYIKARHAYVVPIFYKPHNYKKVFLIPIDKFVKLKGKSIRMPDLEKLNFQTFYL